MKGLHAWCSENWEVDTKGQARCRLCRDATHRLTYARSRVIQCVVKGCPRATHRADGNYVCPQHRAEPPAWFERLNLRIVGTRLETAA